MIRSLILFAVLTFAAPALAGEARVVGALASQSGSGAWRFDVTVSHGDTGWEHYADLWEVLTPDGQRLGQRELLHPHVDEQPFTRSLGGVVVPEGLGEVVIRVHDSQHGWSASGYRLQLPGR